MKAGLGNDLLVGGSGDNALDGGRGTNILIPGQPDPGDPDFVPEPLPSFTAPPAGPPEVTPRFRPVLGSNRFEVPAGTTLQLDPLAAHHDPGQAGPLTLARLVPPATGAAFLTQPTANGGFASLTYTAPDTGFTGLLRLHVLISTADGALELETIVIRVL